MLPDAVTELTKQQPRSPRCASSTARLWVGEQPLQVSLSRQDAVDAGAEAPVEVRADAAFVWALVGSDADIPLLAPDEAEIQDGIGAVLRWSDPATEHLDAPSMPGHGQSPGMPENVE